MEELRIAMAQINTSVGDIEGNTNKILEYIEKAKADGARIVVFPEMAVPGYPPKDLLLSDVFVEDCMKAQQRIRNAAKGIAVVVGGIERGKVEGNLYNTAFVFDEGRNVYTYYKNYLPNYDVFDEKRYFTAGNGNGLFDIDGKTIGINICEDIWIEGGPADVQARQGKADLIINISASPFHYGKTELRQDMIKNHIERGGVPIVYVNQVGGQDDLIFDGQSYAFNKNGELIAQGAHFKEDLVVFSTTGRSITHTPEGAAEEVYEALKLGLRDYVQKNGFGKVVLGLSGGVDSALAATIAADALGPANVLCILMPSRFSSDHSVTDAKKLAENLGASYEIIPIEPAYKAFVGMLSPVFGNTPFGVAEENIQARVRMIALYGIANKFGSLVLNTSNKSEAAIGYGTIYGDMGGDISVIGDVPKTMAYELCRHVNEIAGYQRIPENIITKEPSAELKENQRDSDYLPNYDVLDHIINGYVEQVRSPASMVQEGVDPEVLKDVVRRIDNAENKRYRTSPTIKITPRAFGTGRRMPIANGYKNRVV